MSDKQMSENKDNQRWEGTKGDPRKHHYLPQWFLKSWTFNKKEQIFRVQKNGPTSNPRIKNVGSKGDLYSLPSYSKEVGGLEQNFELSVVAQCENYSQKTINKIREKNFENIDDLLYDLDFKEQLFRTMFIFKHRSPHQINKDKEWFGPLFSAIVKNKEHGFLGPEASRNLSTNKALREMLYGYEAKLSYARYDYFLVNFTGLVDDLIIGDNAFSRLRYTESEYIWGGAISPQIAVFIGTPEMILKLGTKELSFMADFANLCSKIDSECFYSKNKYNSYKKHQYLNPLFLLERFLPLET